MRTKAVLLDSGGVLMRPIGGRWNPRPDFEATVLSHAPEADPDDLARAIEVGDSFLASSPRTPDRDEYHSFILRAAGMVPTADLLARLSRPVDPTAILEVFPDVLPMLSVLRRRGLRLAVVSDTWPDLPDLHAALGIGAFFDVYVISAVLGCTKPDPRTYHHASDMLGLTPAECLYVDDDPALVAAAIELGYQGRAICRGGGSTSDVPSVTTLTEILPLLERGGD